MLKLAFTGSHSTGKTTLLSDIRSELENEIKVNYITEVARGIIRRGYPLNMDANVDSYVHYINDQLNAEIANMKECSLFISDRTVLDPVAYAVVNAKLPRPYIPDYFIDMMKNVWLLEQKKYDLYVYFPVEFPMDFDGVRPFDEKYRNDIDEAIRYLLEENRINHITISGNREKRKKIMIETIHQLMRDKGDIFPKAK